MTVLGGLSPRRLCVSVVKINLARNEKSLGRQGRVSAEARVRSGGLRGARPRRWPSHLGRQGRVSAEAPRYAVSLRGTVMKPPLW